MGRRDRSESGQSLTETIVMLPVLLMLLMGLDYFFELTAMRMRAIEAARYLTWESSWFLRDHGTEFGADRPLPASASIQDIKIGRFFVAGQADAATRTVQQYVDDVTAKDFTTVEPRAVAGNVVKTLKAADGIDALAGVDLGGALGDLTSIVGNIASATEDAGFTLQNFWARNLNWDHEADKSIYTARVEYKSFGINFFHLVPATDIVQFSSILSHPLLIARTDDDTEFKQLVGDNDVGDCFSDDSKGHIFDAWFLPVDFGNLGGIGGAVSFMGNAGKCLFSSIGSAFQFIDNFGTNVGFRLPDGTLKEFPEKR